MVPNNEVPTLKTFNRVMRKGHGFQEVVSMSNEVRKIMRKVGYSDEIHRQGWHLYSSLRTIKLPWFDEVQDDSHKLAMDALRDYVKESFPLARAAMAYRYAEQHRYVFEPIDGQEGIDPVAAMELFTDKTEALIEGSDPEREGSRELDRQVMQILESRFIIDSQIRERLRGLVAQAKTLAAPVDDPAELARFLELYQDYRIWLKDWRRTARHAVKSKRLLIRLGLTRVRRKKEKAEDEQPPSCPLTGKDVACPMVGGGTAKDPVTAGNDAGSAEAGNSPGSRSSAAAGGTGGAAGDSAK